METRCQKCGAPVGGEQAFCPRCGAVVGMADAGASRDEGWDMAATMVGQKLPPAPTPAPTPRHAQPQPQPPQPSPAGHPAGVSAQAPAARGGYTVLLAVIGFVAVLLIVGLALLLLYLNSQG